VIRARHTKKPAEPETGREYEDFPASLMHVLLVTGKGAPGLLPCPSRTGFFKKATFLEAFCEILDIASRGSTEECWI
jgi:hypothetical protein